MPSGTRIPAADNPDGIDNEDGPKKALNLMREALNLLDLHHGPHDVRAHLDLAIHHLQQSIDERKGRSGWSGESNQDRS